MSTGEEAAYLAALLEGPALSPPDGVEPNLSSEGSHSLGYAILILACTLSTISVFVRLGSRLAMKRIGIEDVLMVCALVRMDPQSLRRLCY
jgi:hypothetical protein